MTEAPLDPPAIDAPLEPEPTVPAGAEVVAGDIDVATVMSRHRGPFRAGDLVQLTDAKSRKHTVDLAVGKTFFTHKGAIAHDHLFHTLLGLFDVRTALYEPRWDFSAACRRDAAGAPR